MMSNTTAVRPWPMCGDVVDRRAADVHRHLARLARRELDRVARAACRGCGPWRIEGSGRPSRPASVAIRAARRPSTAMPSARPDGADALTPLGLHRDEHAVGVRAPAPLRLRGHRGEVRREARAARRRSRRRRSRPASRRSGALHHVAEQLDRRGVAVARRPTPGTGCRDRAGRPARAGRRRPRGDRVGVGVPGEPAAPSMVTPPSTSGRDPSAPNGWTS